MRELGALLDEIERLAMPAIAVEIAAHRGSTPRESDAFLVATRAAFAGTIGGGQLEFHALDIARSMLLQPGGSRRLDIALGPLLGQCCGGQVGLEFSPVDASALARLRLRLRAAQAQQPDILIFGLGHTGRALAKVLALLPMRVSAIDDRADVFDDLPAAITLRRLDDPAEAIAHAPAGAAYIVFTHNHSLDYRLVDIALRRGDAAYVGMIGSQTKLARFRTWFLQRGGGEANFRRLTCPIGGDDVADKRPEIIAGLTSAQIIRAFAAAQAGAASASRMMG